MKNPNNLPRNLGLWAALLAVVASGATASAQCALHPIALSVQTLNGVVEGSLLDDIFNGSQPGNFGWLTWTGDPSEPTLSASLSLAGDSYTYVNPFDASDTVVSAGDWVQGKPGLSNSKGVRMSLDDLVGIIIRVPVWDAAQGSGNNTLYHVVGFADVAIVDYKLSGQDRISAVFIGFADCGGGAPPD
jgi:hypothetical protein